MTRTNPGRRFLVAGAAVALGCSLAGCSSLANAINGDAAADDATGASAEGGTIDAFSVEIGDCIANPGDGEITEIEVVPCDEPHDGEVYDEVRMADGEWPGAVAVGNAAEEGCVAKFEDFIGIPYNGEPESSVYVQFLTPVEETWNDPDLEDRLISCVVYIPGEKITGTLKDSRR